jgi:lysophospholipase L1-like esterase
MQTASADHARNPRSRRRKLAFVLVIWIVILLAGELVARFVLLPRGPLIATTLDAVPNLRATTWFRHHPRLFWELRPNLDLPLSRWGDRTNSLGFRGPREPRERKDRTRVLCLGDSCTYGLGLPWDLAWPARLDLEKDLEVLNAGVPGYTSHQGRALFADRGRDLRPDVLVLQFGTNDANLWPVLRGGVVHCLSDRQVSEHLRVAGVARYCALAGAVLAILRPPEATPVPGFSETDHGTAPPRVPPEELVENLRAMADEVPFTVVLIWPLRRFFDPAFTDPVPRSRSREYRESMLAQGGDGIAVIDLHDVFARAGMPAAEIFSDDVHATARGARLVADEVRRAIRDR